MERYPTSEGIELNRFKTISDFKWCVNCGGEIEFEWKGKGDQKITIWNQMYKLNMSRF